MPSKEEIEIDIWGCCVSRDIFSFYHPGIKINNYFQECSPVVAFSDEELPEITMEDLKKYQIGRLRGLNGFLLT